MNAPADFDWLNSTQSDRKQLYGVTKRLADTTGLTLAQVIHAAIGKTFAGGYEDNFRAGRMSRKNCMSLHSWMKQHHPQFADELVRALSAPHYELPGSAISNIASYYRDKCLLFTGREPDMVDLDPRGVSRALGDLFIDGKPNRSFSIIEPRWRKP